MNLVVPWVNFFVEAKPGMAWRSLLAVVRLERSSTCLTHSSLCWKKDATFVKESMCLQTYVVQSHYWDLNISWWEAWSNQCFFMVWMLRLPLRFNPPPNPWSEPSRESEHSPLPRRGKYGKKCEHWKWVMTVMTDVSLVHFVPVMGAA